MKLFRVDERRRGYREWCALRLLADLGFGHAPRADLLHDHPQAPSLVMEYRPGRGLDAEVLDGDSLSALASILRALYSITPAAARGASVEVTWLTVGHPQSMLDRVQDGYRQRSAEAQPLARRAILDVWRRWLEGRDPATVLQPARPVFSSGDPNLANCLRLADGSVGLVDFEYSGWCDRAYDVACLVEHVNSRATPDDTWAQLLDLLQFDECERQRFRAVQRLFALFWVLKLWPTIASAPDAPIAAGQDDRFSQIEQRALRLCG